MSPEILTNHIALTRKCKLTIISLVLLLVAACCGTPLAAGSGPWQPLQLLQPSRESGQTPRPLNLAIDRERQRYYLIDGANAMITAFDNGGTELSRFNADGAFVHPVAMVRDSSDNLWISDRGLNSLLHLSLKNRQMERYTLTRPGQAMVIPDRLAIDQQNNIYCLDLFSGEILKYQPDLSLDAVFALPAGGRGFMDLKLKGDRLWALDGTAKTASVFALDGTREQTISLPTSLQFAIALEVDQAGALYLLDRHAGTIVVCDRSGRLRYRFMSKGELPGQLAYGAQLLFDWQGNLVVADEGNGRIEIFGR
ncbi:MAG: hypothetical protein JXO49_00670 [Deltaproteobacteria bacterium]|nr:hypothetical protein [Candidatus Anaeroferrophillus wilburensis]MBN2887838.1 hypothetical protein [Deltaproteobacteria bacterium]